MTSDQLSKLHNTQAEVEVLSSLLFNPNLYETLQNDLSRDLFNDWECIRVFDAIKGMADEGKMPDLMEVGQRLAELHIDIRRFVTDMAGGYTLTKQRIDLLGDLMLRRKMVGLMMRGENMLLDPTVTMEALQGIIRDFDKVIANDAGEHVQSFGSVVGNLMNEVADRMNDKGDRGIMTGIHIFDSHYGWHAGDFILIAGRTSMGKSTLATTIAYNIAVDDVPVAYYSMEMGSKQLVARMSARSTGVSASTTLYAKLSPAEYQKVYDGTLAMKQLPIYFDEDSKTSFPQMCNSIRRMKKMYGIRVVFIDYLQILANGQRDNREAILGDMARDLKRLAVEEQLVIVALSQLNRADADKGEPRLNQMRGSGQIEEACDLGVLINRQNLKNETATITIAKGRNVGLAKEKVKFNSNLSYFADFEEGDPQAPYQDKKEELPF